MEEYVVRNGPSTSMIRRALDGAYSNPRDLLLLPRPYGGPGLEARVVGFEYADANDFGHCWVTIEVTGYQRVKFEYHFDHRGGRATFNLTPA